MINAGRHAKRLWCILAALSAGASVACMPRIGRADFLPVYSGPNAVGGLRHYDIAVNAAGVAVGNNYFEKCDDWGCWTVQRAFRWSAADITS
jgi:hypothetical protein